MNDAMIVREVTGCAITEAQKALIETNGSTEEAIKLCKDTPAQHTRRCPKSKFNSKDKCICGRIDIKEIKNKREK